MNSRNSKKLYARNEEGAGRDPSVSRELLEQLRYGNPPEIPDENNGQANPGAGTFRMRCQRMYEDLLDFLLHHDLLEGDETLTEVSRAKVQVKKLFAQYQILGNRGLYKAAIDLLNNIAEIADQFELYEDAIHALGDLSNIYASLNDKFNYDRIVSRLNTYTRVFEVYRKALQLYNSSSLRIVFHPDTLRKNPEIEKEMVQIRNLFYEFRQPRIGWFYHHITMRYHLVRREYTLAEEAGYRMLELQRLHPSIGSDSMVGATYNMLAHAHMHRFRFDYALEAVQQAQYYFRYNRINLTMARELEFLCLLYAKKPDKAEERINELLAETSERFEKFKWSLHQYLKACVHFVKGEFTKANKILVMEMQEIEKDKEGYNINTRIVDLMVLIENKKYDVAARRIDSFKKHMDRMLQAGGVKERYIKIFQLLKELAESDYNFRRVWAARRQILEDLGGDEANALAWEILSSEVLPFQVWFESKATNVSFYDALFKFFARRQGPDVYFLKPVAGDKKKGK